MGRGYCLVRRVCHLAARSDGLRRFHRFCGGHRQPRRGRARQRATIVRGRTMRTLRDSHVVITGGTGALGSAVARALVEAGAHCHVPAIETSVPADRFPKDKVSVTTNIDLSDEAAVEGFYAKLPA